MTVEKDNGFCAKPTVAKHAIINDKINFFITFCPKFVSSTTSIILLVACNLLSHCYTLKNFLVHIFTLSVWLH